MTQTLQQTGSPKTTRLERSITELCRAEVKRGPAWLVERRTEALEWLSAHGMPKPKDEAFRNLSLSPIADESLHMDDARDKASAIVEAGLLTGNGPVLWLVDGVPMTDCEAIAGVRWLSLSEALAGEESVRNHLGRYAKLENGFVAANAAAFSDAWCLLVDPGQRIEAPIEIRIVDSAQSRGKLSLPRVLVVAGAQSQLRLIERHCSRAGQMLLSAAVVEIALEQGAKVEHARWVEHGSATWSFATTAVSVAEDAEYRSWSVTARGRAVRHDLAVTLRGRGASVTLDGLYYGRTGEVVDQHTRVWHEQPAGRTRESYRGVIEDGGRGIFDGIIYVGRGAMQTDAQQENRNLLLGPSAIAHTKPHLEIDADDVVCSHGATVGQLDDEQLFYLRSRGVAEDQARQVLTGAFAREIVERCPEPALRQEVETALIGIADEGPTLPEVCP